MKNGWYQTDVQYQYTNAKLLPMLVVNTFNGSSHPLVYNCECEWEADWSALCALGDSRLRQVQLQSIYFILLRLCAVLFFSDLKSKISKSISGPSFGSSNLKTNQSFSDAAVL